MELGGTSPAEVAHVVLVSIRLFIRQHRARPTAVGTRDSAAAPRQDPGPGHPARQFSEHYRVRYSIWFTVLSLPPTAAPRPGSEKRTRSRENTQDAGAFAAGKVKLLRFSSGFDRRASLLEVPCISHTPYQEGSFF